MRLVMQGMRDCKSQARYGTVYGMRSPTFAGFPTFCPITFHLLASYSLMAASNAALCRFLVSQFTSVRIHKGSSRRRGGRG